MSVAKLAEELTRAGQELTVLATTANGTAELDVPVGVPQMVDGVEVYYFKRWTKDHTHFSPSLLLFLHQEIKRHKRNKQLIVHIHAWWNLVSIFSCLIAKWHGVRVVLSPRGMLTNYTLNNRNSKVKDIIHSLIGKKLLAYSHIHATSTKELNDVSSNFKVDGITVIPNFVALPDRSFFESKPVQHAYGDTVYQLLFLSRVEQKKGLELLFEALTKTDIPWELTIAGSGEKNYLAQLQNLAETLGLAERIKWLGHVSNDQKFQLMASKDLTVLTSYNENFANVVIESLAMGTPVLLSKEVGLADYVQNNNLGWITDLNPEMIAETLTSSFHEVAARQNIRGTAPLLVKEDLDGEKLKAQYINMYQHLI